VRDALVTGDFFVTPPRTIFDLEAALRGVEAAEAGAATERFFAQANVGLLSVSAAEFRAAIDAAIASDARSR
jgi:lipoate-protein ligase A